MKFGVFLLHLAAISVSCTGLSLNWLYYPFQLFSKEAVEVSVYPHNEALVDVQYESHSEYDKFISEAQRVIDINLSDVDICYHKVIMKLKTSCSTLTEDELGKLGVQLLNCKSAEEGKQQFSCTSSMGLEDCTRNMDADMWNSYRVMSEKARALCFSARQQLFKALTEMVVNKLMDSSKDQLKSMKYLQEGQKLMLDQQHTLREAQDAVSVALAAHLRYLEKENALVKANQGEVAKIVQGIHQKLDATNSQMDTMATERKSSHNKLLKNLRTLQEQVLVLLQSIDQSIRLVNEKNAEMASKYQAAIGSLSQINSTVHYLLNLMELMHNELDARMKWMSSFIGGTGDPAAVICALALHAGYLLLGMVAMAFVGAPIVSRLLLLVLVPANLLLTINPSHASKVSSVFFIESFDFLTMTVIIVAFTLGSSIVVQVVHLWKASHTDSMNKDSWNSNLRGGQFIDRPKAHPMDMKTRNPGVVASAIRAVGSALDPRCWWSNGQCVDDVKDGWSRGLGNCGPSPTAPSRDIDDSSDTDGPLLVEKDDDEYEFEQGYCGSVLDRSNRANFLQKNFLAEDGMANHPSSALHQGDARRSTTPKGSCRAICQNGLPCRNSCMNGHRLCHRHSLPGRN